MWWAFALPAAVLGRSPNKPVVGFGWKLRGAGGAAGALQGSSQHQELVLSADSKGGAAKWRLSCATCAW